MNKLENKKDNTYIFIDISNIYIGFYKYVENRYKLLNPRINCKSLLNLLENKRNIQKRVLVGSCKKNILKKTRNNNYENKLHKIFKKNDYNTYILERHEKEKGVDELLHNNIMETLLFSNEVGTIVIATGDGKSSDFTDNSFYNLVLKALEIGWSIEIITWKYQMNKNYQYGHELNALLKNKEIKKRYNIIYLEKYVNELIY